MLSLILWLCCAILMATGWRDVLLPGTARSVLFLVGLFWLFFHDAGFGLLSEGRGIQPVWLLWCMIAGSLAGMQAQASRWVMFILAGRIVFIGAVWLWTALLSQSAIWPLPLLPVHSASYLMIIAIVLLCSREWTHQWIMLTLGLTAGEGLLQLKMSSSGEFGSDAVQDAWWVMFVSVRLLSAVIEWSRHKWIQMRLQ
ncbi:permease [Paenibacillus thiaminolyticus]|uniref:permease n=1 Tax=Paenibacillus thiaminolyticus TaxID=49283 RepID=UPI0023503AAB|nr:permease [Paenibacillus thiaminolyticus]WCR27848.1 permease [Paenibacillus thiaminolyticus]